MLTILAATLLLRPMHGSMVGAKREDKNGWIFIHLQGSPHDVGYQHATLLGQELVDAIDAVKIEAREDCGKDWDWFRDTAYSLYWNKLDPEYQQEMQGMADGANDKNLPVDLKDILAMNANIELKDYYLPWLEAHGQLSLIKSKAPFACSAFVATGSETKDGGVVMGHNLWWDYFVGGRWKILEDVKPAKGHEFVMDTLPGFIHSGSDWGQNDSGILITETTISGFVGYNPNGIPEFQRMRKAIQYSSSLDDIVKTFETGNNGGYANTWLLADTKTNEIGKLELGLQHVAYHHTKDGAYYGANYPEDPLIIQDEASGYDTTVAGNVCELRRQRWGELMAQNKGKVDADLAMQFLGDTYNTETKSNDGLGSALCSKGFPVWGAVNAKVTTTELAKKMSLWARIGVTDGTPEPKEDVISRYHFTGEKARLWPDLPTEPWTVFSCKA